MGHIYLSYSSQDRGAAQRLAESLRAKGYEVWFDADADVSGSSLRGKSADAINRADACIFLISPASAKSRWSTEELSLALKAQCPLVPVILEPTPLPESLVNRQFVDASKNWDQAVQQIILALEANIGLAQARQQPAAPAAAPVAPALATPVRGRRAAWWVAALIIVLVGGGFLFIVLTLSSRSLPGTASPTSIATSLASVPTRLPPGTPLPPMTLTAIAQEIPTNSFTAPFETQVAAGAGLDDVDDIVAATVVAIRATDDSSLSPQEAAILLNTTNSSATAIWVTGILAALALGASVGAVVMVLTGRGARRRTGHPSAHHSQPLQADSASAGPAPLEEYQIFISSSEKDKDWVASLVEDLGAMNYLVWWYVKDAPGLPFGNEIRGAIFHAKVLVIIVSTASMKSKHIEEEIRWAEIYDRPIIPVLYEPVDVQERLYGLAKGADIDFTDDRNYKESIELLTQAIDHYLKQRLQVVQGGAENGKK